MSPPDPDRYTHNGGSWTSVFRRLASALLPRPAERAALVRMHITSMAPRNIERQLECLQSWRASSDRICTINHPREQAVLGPLLPDWVEAIPVEFEPRYGKDYLPLSMLCRTVAKMGLSPNDIVTIANSDISLREPGLLSGDDLAHCDLLYASRVDLDKEGNSLGPFLNGFDVFMFNAADIHLLDADGYYLGLPWWDYVVPLVFAKEGRKIGRIDEPVITHKAHDIDWSYENWLALGASFSADLFGLNVTAKQSERRIQMVAKQSKAFLNNARLRVRSSKRLKRVPRADFGKLQRSVCEAGSARSATLQPAGGVRAFLSKYVRKATS